MAIPVNTGFNVGAPISIDQRLVLTKSEMLNIDDNIMPDYYFAVCKDDGAFYIYDKNLDISKISEVTGKFKPATEEEIEEVFQFNKINNYEVSSITNKSYIAIADENGENKKVPWSSVAGFLMDQNNISTKDYVDSKIASVMNTVGTSFTIIIDEDVIGEINDVASSGATIVVTCNNDTTPIAYSDDDGKTWKYSVFVNDKETGPIVKATKIMSAFGKFFTIIEHENGKFLYVSESVGLSFTNTGIVVDDIILKNNILYYIYSSYVFYTMDGTVWNNASVRKNLEPVNTFIIESEDKSMLLTEDAWSDDGGYIWNAFRYFDPVTNTAIEIAESKITKIVEIPNLNIWLASLSTGGMYYSTDGKIWRDVSFNPNIQEFSKEITDICVTDNVIVASNYNLGAEHYRPIYSTNGIDWLLCAMYDKDGNSKNYLDDAEGIGKVSYNGSIFVYGGAEYYSTDGKNWYPCSFETNVLSFDYDHPIYDNGIWVATPNTRLNVSGPIIKSTDGKVWSMNDTKLSGKIGNLMFEYGIFLARTTELQGNTLYYSLNGLTWNECNFDSEYNITQNPVFNGDVWVMVTSNESGDVVFMYSIDGINWNFGGTEANYKIDFQKNPVWIGTGWLFVIKNKTTGSSKLVYSRDGIRWSEKAVSGPDIDINDENNYSILVYLQKKVFLTSVSKQQTWYSDDKAASFYLCKKNTILEINHPAASIEFNNGKFYSMNKNYPYNIIQSSDGIFWSVIDAVGTSTNADDFSVNFSTIYNGCISFNNIVFYTATNGNTWERSDLTTTESSTIVSNPYVFLIKSDSTLKYSYLGENWLDPVFDIDEDAIATFNTVPVWNGALWVVFATTTSGSDIILTSKDGITWTKPEGSELCGGCNSAVIWNNNVWVATGKSGIAYSETGTEWSKCDLYTTDGVVTSSAAGYEKIYINDMGTSIVLYSTNSEYSLGSAIANSDNAKNIEEKVYGQYKSIDLTQAEYDAIPEEQRSKTNPYNCYDTGRIYKNGVLYGEKKSEEVTLEEYEALEAAGLVEEDKDYIIKSDEEGSPLFDAKYIKYDNTESGIEAKNVQRAIDELAEVKKKFYISNDISNILYYACEYFGVNCREQYQVLEIEVVDAKGQNLKFNSIYKHEILHHVQVISENGITLDAIDTLGTLAFENASDYTIRVKYIDVCPDSIGSTLVTVISRSNKNALTKDVSSKADTQSFNRPSTYNTTSLPYLKITRYGGLAHTQYYTCEAYIICSHAGNVGMMIFTRNDSGVRCVYHDVAGSSLKLTVEAYDEYNCWLKYSGTESEMFTVYSLNGYKPTTNAVASTSE